MNVQRVNITDTKGTVDSMPLASLRAWLVRNAFSVLDAQLAP